MDVLCRKAAARGATSCRPFRGVSNQKSAAGSHIQRKADVPVVQGGIGQTIGSAVQELRRTGVQKRLQVAGINLDGILAQFAVKRPAGPPGLQLGDEGLALLQGEIEGDGGGVDQVKLLRHGGKREGTALITAAEGVQDPLLIQGGVALQGAVKGKIGFDGLRAGRIGKVRQHIAGGIHIGPDHGRGALAFQTENGDQAFGGRAEPFPVAAARRLQNGIETGFFPPGGRKIHVHACFDQRGGDHPAGFAVQQAGADLVQEALAVGRAEQGGQAITPLRFQHGIELLRCGAAIDHTQGLRLGIQPAGKRFFGQGAGLAQGGAVEKVVEGLGVRAELLHREAGRQLREQRLQGRLRGGAEHSGDAVGLHQLPDGFHTGQQRVDGQGLRFIENHNAVGNVVQLAAAGRPVAVEGLKKLHRCGDDHGRIPILCCKGFAVKCGIDRIVAGRVVRAGVVFKDIFVPQDAPKGFGGLVDDGRVGDHIDDPGQVVSYGVGEGKSQRGNGFAAAGGDRQGIKAGGPFPTGIKAAL